MSAAPWLPLLGLLLSATLPGQWAAGCPASGATCSAGAAALAAGDPAAAPSFAIGPAPLDDRVAHFLAGMSACLIAEALVTPSLGGDPGGPTAVAATGFAVALAAGVLKETADASGFGDSSLGDLLDTAAGGLVAAGASLLLTNLWREHRVHPEAGAFVFASFGLVLAAPVAVALAAEIHRRTAPRRAAAAEEHRRMGRRN